MRNAGQSVVQPISVLYFSQLNSFGYEQSPVHVLLTAEIINNFSNDLLDELIHLLEKSDSFNYTKILINNHFERAINHLSVFPKSNAKLLLENVAEYATTRKL